MSLGIDVVAVDRMRRALDRYGARFAARILGPSERDRWGDDPAHLALCFAVKESVVKALGGWGDRAGWTEIELELEDGGSDVPPEMTAALGSAVSRVQSGTWSRRGGSRGWWAAGDAPGRYVVAIAAANP